MTTRNPTTATNLEPMLFDDLYHTTSLIITTCGTFMSIDSKEEEEDTRRSAHFGQSRPRSKACRKLVFSSDDEDDGKKEKEEEQEKNDVSW